MNINVKHAKKIKKKHKRTRLYLVIVQSLWCFIFCHLLHAHTWGFYVRLTCIWLGLLSWTSRMLPNHIALMEENKCWVMPIEMHSRVVLELSFKNFGELLTLLWDWIRHGSNFGLGLTSIGSLKQTLDYCHSC